MNYGRVLHRILALPGYIWWVSYTVLLGIAASAFVGNWIWTGALFLPLLILVEALSRSPILVAYLVARQSFVGFALAGILVASGLFVGLGIEPYAAWEQLLSQFSLKYAGFLVLGALIGTLFRQAIERVAFSALAGRKRLGLNVVLATVWTIGVLLYPMGKHSAQGFSYLLGLGLGVLLHRGSAVGFAQAAAGYRRVQDIADAFPPNEPATPTESKALELLGAGRQFPSMRFKRLRRFLDESLVAGRGSKRLTLIRAAIERLEGHFQSALAETDRANEPLREPLDAHIDVLRVITLNEMGKSQEARALLDRILASQFGRCCPISNALRAEEIAREALADPVHPMVTRRGLVWAMRAINLRSAITRERGRLGTSGSIDSFLARFVEIGVPITPSFMLSILGLGLVAAGHPEEGRVALVRGVGIDPGYSSLYLYLGDSFIFRRMLSLGAAVPSQQDLWHAEAAYQAAKLVERNRTSRVHAYANQRLAEVRMFRGLPTA